MRRANPQSQRHATPYTFPAPARGWTETDNPASARPGGASVLENFLPTLAGCRLRGGCRAVSDATAPILEMFAYDNAVTRKLFVTTADGIRDASLMDLIVAPSVLPAFSGANVVTAQFTTLGDTFLYAVNGADDPHIFDGSTWQRVGAATTPISITGTGSDKFSHVWAFKSRLFFAVANSMKVWALPVGQVGGEAVDLNLAGVFQNGGRVLFGTTWTADSGSGFADRCVIVTDRGEVAIYEGIDPADPNNWRLVGRYEIPPPLGVNAHVKVSGDVLIATMQGLIPLSGVASKDPLALESIAVSRPISRTWLRTAAGAGTGWKLVKWANAGCILVIPPAMQAEVWGVYAQTGAWFKITGWDMKAATMHDGRLYFGGLSGFVQMADATGRDDGTPFVGKFRGLMDQAPRPGHKVVQQARAWFNTSDNISASVRFVSRDDAPFGQLPLPWTPISILGRWDNGRWDQMMWDQGGDEMRLAGTHWRSMGAAGEVIAPEVQVVSDADLPSTCELVSIDALIESGGFVV